MYSEISPRVFPVHPSKTDTKPDRRGPYARYESRWRRGIRTKTQAGTKKQA
nr:MAG TPA: hypothetical protein [Caudoviricetes sp.]